MNKVKETVMKELKYNVFKKKRNFFLMEAFSVPSLDEAWNASEKLHSDLQKLAHEDNSLNVEQLRLLAFGTQTSVLKNTDGTFKVTVTFDRKLGTVRANRQDSNMKSKGGGYTKFLSR